MLDTYTSYIINAGFPGSQDPPIILDFLPKNGPCENEETIKYVCVSPFLPFFKQLYSAIVFIVTSKREVQRSMSARGRTHVTFLGHQGSPSLLI